MKNKLTYLNNANPTFIEDLFLKYQEDSKSVPESWRHFFEGYQLGLDQLKTSSTSFSPLPNQEKEGNVIKLIQAYRARGHLIANLNPLDKTKKSIPDLNLEYFKLSKNDLETTFQAGKDLKMGQAKLKDILSALNKIYASHFAIEFIHCNRVLRQWIYQAIEPSQADPLYSSKKKKKLFSSLTKTSVFENYLQIKYVGQKRFGLEGGESLIPGLESLIERGVQLGATEFVFGMAHRGRLNVLVNIFKKSYFHLFTEFEGGQLPDHIKGDGDVKYHLGQSTDIEINKKNIHLSLTFNPSHLEAVNSIVTGIVKGKCKKYHQNNMDEIIPVIIHGDASVSGQGVVYEHANMSQLPGYRNGGSIHIVINNQLGFTANPNESRSSHHCTEVAKITSSPIFHVNGDDVEKVSYAMEMAMEIRNKFHIDVWVDIIGFRRRGHNEADDPKFTQPLMYQKIETHPGTYQIYLDQLLEEKVITKEEAQKMKKEIKEELDIQADKARKDKSHINVNTLKRYWQNIRPTTIEDFLTPIETKVKIKILDKLLNQLLTIPPDFNLYPKMKKILEQRRHTYFKEKKIDWALSEQLAFASLLNEGNSIRLSGQDSERGTFSHRHAIIKDQKTEKKHLVYDPIAKKSATFVVINSQLSEYSILGYEYGFSLARPHALVIWEAQFGDFANGAQIVIDQFISSAETKWQRHSGIVLFLPHGYEGMGPEHSSARLERFLQLCAGNNMYVMNITEPANLFHALRRQVVAPFRKPLIVMTPKSLLRHPLAVSPVNRLNESLLEIIDDNCQSEKITRIILCTGKIYYELYEKREQEKRTNIAIIRIEQIYPLQINRLNQLREKYRHVKEWLWVQEEPVNMGAWTFIHHRLIDYQLVCVARNTSSSPASGIQSIHKKNQEAIIDQAINKKINKLKKYY